MWHITGLCFRTFVSWSVCRNYYDINFSHICHIVPWLCAWGGCTTIRCWLKTYPEKAVLCPFYYCTVLWCVQMIEYIMARWSYSFVCTLYYLIIIIMQTYLLVLHSWITRQMHSIECVFKIKSFLSIICHAVMQYMGLCVFGLPISLTMIVRISLLYLNIIIKSEVWHICHGLWYDHETMLCAVYLLFLNWKNWSYTAICERYYSLYVELEIEVVDIGLSNWIEIFKFCNFTYLGFGKWAKFKTPVLYILLS